MTPRVIIYDLSFALSVPGTGQTSRMNKLVGIREFEFVDLPSVLGLIFGVHLLPQLASLDSFHNPRDHFLVTISLTLQDDETPIDRSMTAQPHYLTL